MSNIERAAETILTYVASPECYDPEITCLGCIEDAHQAAHDLDNKRLLAPDLPEPDDCPQDIHTPGWHLDALGKYAAVLAGKVWITDERGWGRSFSPDKAREMGLKLIAAADSAEVSQ